MRGWNDLKIMARGWTLNNILSLCSFNYIIHFHLQIMLVSELSVTYLSVGEGKVKCTLLQALRLCTGRTARRESKGIALPFHDHGTRRGWVVSATTRPLFTPGKTRYPLYRRLGGPQGWSGQVQKISPPTPPGFDPRTVQPIANRYSDWATWPFTCLWPSLNLCNGWNLKFPFCKQTLCCHFCVTVWYA